MDGHLGKINQTFAIAQGTVLWRPIFGTNGRKLGFCIVYDDRMHDAHCPSLTPR